VADSVIKNAGVCASRAVEMVTAKRIITIDGKYLNINPDSICVHGDTAGAVAILIAVRKAFENKGVLVKPFRGRRVNENIPGRRHLSCLSIQVKI
jgi:5-oxoprolinase (ATP-hydrolysing) subunit A